MFTLLHQSFFMTSILVKMSNLIIVKGKNLLNSILILNSILNEILQLIYSQA